MIQDTRSDPSAPLSPGNRLSPWAEALVNAALPHAPKDGSVQTKTEFVRALTAQIQACLEFEKWDPRTIESVVAKRDYKSVEELKAHTADVNCLQALPDGRIVSGSDDNTLRIWTKSAGGKWDSEVLSGHTDSVRCLQALPDGKIVSGSNDRTLRIWTKSAGGGWDSEVLSGHNNYVNCLQALPDGRIVSGSDDTTLRIWTKSAGGKWDSEVLSGHNRSVWCLQVLPDGTIVSGSDDRTLRIWDGTPIDGGTP